MVTFGSINLSTLLIVCLVNFSVDGDSSRHVPGERSFFPRTTNHSALSKLHYLAVEKPEIVYFGSSRVEIGLPAAVDYFGRRTVYNAGLSANTLGNTVPLMKHFLAIAEPKVLVLGVDFVGFSARPGALSNLDMSLLSNGIVEYRLKRFLHDLKRTITVDVTMHTARSIWALWTGGRYDEILGVGSILGQTSDAEMMRLTVGRGRSVTAFQRKLKLADGPPPTTGDVADGIAMLDDFVGIACARRIVLRVFYNPRHALAEHMLIRNNGWLRLEQWKVELGKIATKYSVRCDVKAFDFSGYNSITTESAASLTPANGLRNYWEASHYKTVVGEMILGRLFSLTNVGVPEDFGRELTEESAPHVNLAVRNEQLAYLAAHGEEVALAHKWATHFSERGD